MSSKKEAILAAALPVLPILVRSLALLKTMQCIHSSLPTDTTRGAFCAYFIVSLIEITATTVHLFAQRIPCWLATHNVLVCSPHSIYGGYVGLS